MNAFGLFVSYLTLKVLASYSPALTSNSQRKYSQRKYSQRKYSQRKYRLDCQTPKALTKSSPGLFQPWEYITARGPNAESVGQLFQSFNCCGDVNPGLFQPWEYITARGPNAESVGQLFQSLNCCANVKPRVATTLGTHNHQVIATLKALANSFRVSTVAGT